MEFLFLRAASKKSRAAEASPKYEERILAPARDVAFDRVRQFRATSMSPVDVFGSLPPHDAGTFRMNIQDGGLIIRRNDNADVGE